MSKFENKPGFGALFRETNKKSENGPDYRGTFADPNGVEYEIAGWLKDGKKGKYLSLKIQPPREQRETVSRPDPRDGDGFVTEPLEDDIPF